MGKSFREESRVNYTSDHGGNLTKEELKLGSLLRIADATEKMAANYAALQRERDRYLEWYENSQKSNARLRRSVASLRGYIARLKRLSRED